MYLFISFIINQFFGKHKTILISGFGPCQLIFIPKVKINAERLSETTEEIEENALKVLHTVPKNDFQNAFLKWKSTGNRVLTVEGTKGKE